MCLQYETPVPQVPVCTQFSALPTAQDSLLLFPLSSCFRNSFPVSTWLLEVTRVLHDLKWCYAVACAWHSLLSFPLPILAANSCV